MQQLKTTDPVSVGPYRLAGRLGAGGMGVVYLGVSLTADLFAIKMITPGLVSDDELRTRFADEVDVLKTVHGSRVARLERADLTADPPWLATEYVPGRSLQIQVETAGALDVRTGAMLGALLVEGLHSIHDAGLVHRDLKPANIMLGRSGPIVIDFGLAVLRDRAGHLTATGQPVGTLAYMSPEQARGERDLTPATDVYALGATLVYALTGHTVYQQSNPLALLMRIGDPADLPNTAGVPAALAPLIDSMLAYEPSVRPSLDTALQRLVDVATAGDVAAETVRAELAERTFVEESLDLPDWSADPVVDDTQLTGEGVGVRDVDEPGDGADPAADDPTRLVATPAGPPAVAPPGTAGGPGETPGAPPPRPPAEIGWLVEEMRTAYAREVAL